MTDIENVFKEYNIPPQAVKIFADQIPGNRDMDLPLTQGVKYKGLSQHLKSVPIESLPQPVQNVIAEIKSAGNIEEKAAIAHAFSQAYIRDTLQIDNERAISFEELAKDPVGDCDDHMLLTSGLLLYGGVEPKDVFMLEGLMSYHTGTKDLRAGHAFVVVKNEENGYLLLDNNLVGVHPIDPANPVVRGTMADEQGKAAFIDNETTATIAYLSEAQNGRGVVFENPEALKKMTEETIAMFPALKKALEKPDPPPLRETGPQDPFAPSISNM